VQGIGASGSASGWVGNSEPPVVGQTGGGDVPEAASFLVWALLIGSTCLSPRRCR
jgi:hypothetical protein